MRILPFEELPTIPKLKLVVVGHVEWVSFLAVDNLPQEGLICHAKTYLEDLVNFLIKNRDIEFVCSSFFSNKVKN